MIYIFQMGSHIVKADKLPVKTIFGTHGNVDHYEFNDDTHIEII